jgi:hypothetical protein
MDWEPTKINKAVLEQNKQLAGKRAKWVNRDEMERRRKEGSCFRCGRKECRIDKCPLRPARRPDTSETERTRIKKSEPRLPKMEDLIELDDNGSSLSEVDDGESKD